MSENCEKVDNITCFICEKDLENDSEEHVVLVTRGLETLKAVSIERNEILKCTEISSAIVVNIFSACSTKNELQINHNYERTPLLYFYTKWWR